MLGRKEINLKLVLNITGFLIVLEGGFMLLGLPFSLYYSEKQTLYLVISSAATIGSGGILWLLTMRRERRGVNKREAVFLISLISVVLPLFGTFPYLYSGAIPSFTDAFFESISGFTTTGATILKDIDGFPKGLLLWRSMTSWMGGMGIIILSLAILPYLGVGIMQLNTTEIPGMTKDRLHPRIKDTVDRFGAIYVMFTLFEIVFLKLSGLTLFDSICYSFSTISTGGFAPDSANATILPPLAHYIIIAFMFLSGTNFAIHYLALHGRLKDILKNEEFRKYVYILLAFTITIFGLLAYRTGMDHETAGRVALFQVVSTMTTTGFIISDYTTWPGEMWFLIMLLMLTGSMVGSTGSGIRVLRQLLLFKNAGKELKKIIHPHAIIPVRLNRQAIPQDIIYKVMAFFQIYIIVFIFAAAVLSIMGMDFKSAVGASLAALSNTGPGFGIDGPLGNYSQVPIFGKWFLSLLMILGRLELFSVLILFSPTFWKK